MRKFPKFLSQNPTFLGFELPDIFGLLTLFQLLTLLGVDALVSLAASFIIVSCFHILLKRNDLVGFIAGKKMKRFSWLNELKKRGH